MAATVEPMAKAQAERTSQRSAHMALESLTHRRGATIRRLEQTLAALQATTPKKTYKRELELLHDFIMPSKKRKGDGGNKHAKKIKQ